jgi:D-xylonolactonase
LFITTARHGLSAAQLAREPLAGSVLAVEPGVAGLPGNRFAG